MTSDDRPSAGVGQEPQYERIGGVWKCNECDVEGRGGPLGIVYHELRHHTFTRADQDGGS